MATEKTQVMTEAETKLVKLQATDCTIDCVQPLEARRERGHTFLLEGPTCGHINFGLLDSRSLKE